MLKLHMLAVIVRSVFEKNGKYYIFRWMFVGHINARIC